MRKVEKVLGLCMIVSFIFVFAGCETRFEGYDNTKKEESQIVSLRMGLSEIYRPFCLGSGSVGTKTYFVSYRKIADNSFQLLKMDVNRSFIYESDFIGNNKPHVVAYVENCLGKLSNLDGPWPRYRVVRWDIYVPKGTIIEKFNL